MGQGRRHAPAGTEAAAASLVGGGPSLLGVGGAMRARDVSRPDPGELAAAEAAVAAAPPTPARGGRGRTGQSSGSGGSGGSSPVRS